MVKYSVRAELDIPPDVYFQERDSAAFRALMCKVLKLSTMEFMDTKIDEATGAEVVQLVTKPDIDAYVPKSLQPYMRFDLDFYDYLTYDPAKTQGPSYSLTVRSAPGFLKESQYDIRAELTIEPLDDGKRCVQALHGEASIRIMGMGKTAEKIIASSLKQTYATLPEVVQRWVKFREQVLASPGGEDNLRSGRPDIKAFPKEALDMLKHPYCEVDVPEEEEEQAESAAESAAQDLKGKLSLGEDVFYDAEEVLSVDPGLDAVTRKNVLHDKRQAMDEIMGACNGVELDVQVEEEEEQQGPEEGAGAANGTQKASRFFQKGYNAQVKAWAQFWDDVGVATAKVPSMAQRLVYLGDTAEKMGVLKLKVTKVPKRSLRTVGSLVTSGLKPLGKLVPSVAVRKSGGSVTSRASNDAATEGSSSSLSGSINVKEGWESFTSGMKNTFTIGAKKDPPTK